MAALESLSNKELRQKMIEFGMPNVPVTDSSRKILIRRLEAVMSGKPATTTTPNKTNRRETMHVSKPSEMASSAKITAAAALNNNNNTTTSGKPTAANRPSRRTIAATERHVTTTTTVSEPEYSDVSPDRGEVVLTQMLPPKAKTPEKPTLYPKLPAKEPSPKPQVLSKTGVVSTSYIQESSVNKTYAEPIDDIDSTEEEIEQEIMKKPVSSVPSYSATSYVPLSESKVTTSASMPPLASTLSSSTRYSSLNSSYNYSGNTKPSSTTVLNNSTSTSVRKTYQPPTAAAVPQPASRTTISAASTYQPRVGGGVTQKYVSTPDPYDVEYEDEGEELDDDDDEDDVVLVEDSPVKEDLQTPFLSQFARNLETLKATPIRHSIGPTKITPPKTSAFRQRETAAAYNRRTIGGGGGSGGSATISARRSYVNAPEQEESPFRQFMMAMEEKYHLKQTFIIISVFIVAIFIYVFFIQSV
ncbi:otefin [Musca vetustissima]|uniref:otefin n=1 Tax=Musca vetustissima TaxID=27455 RepID=UPI002AB7B841|nr:otefin [Musca vetustissima]